MVNVRELWTNILNSLRDWLLDKRLGHTGINIERGKYLTRAIKYWIRLEFGKIQKRKKWLRIGPSPLGKRVMFSRIPPGCLAPSVTTAYYFCKHSISTWAKFVTGLFSNITAIGARFVNLSSQFTKDTLTSNLQHPQHNEYSRSHLDNCLHNRCSDSRGSCSWTWHPLLVSLFSSMLRTESHMLSPPLVGRGQL